jgi:DNA-binding response OmpR family regulator
MEEKCVLMLHKNRELCDIMRPLLWGEGIELVTAGQFKDATKAMQKQSFQLMVMEVQRMRHGYLQGLEQIREIRRESCIPIIIVSEETQDTAKILCFNAGADDYVDVNCSPLELLARMKSQMKRYIQMVLMCANLERIYRVNELVVDDVCRKVIVEGKEVKLTPIEYKILRLLMQKSGKVLSNNQIYEAIWNTSPVGAENTIAVHIRHIREKIEKNPGNPQYVKAVWGNGYKVG